MLNSALTASHHLMVAVAHSTKATTSSSGTFIYLLFMALIVYVGWRLIFRPQSQRAKQQRQTISLLSVGDEVMTTSGIFGTILEIDGDKVHLQVSDGCVLTMVRSAIGQRLSSSAEGGSGDMDGSALDGGDWQDGEAGPERDDDDGSAAEDDDDYGTTDGDGIASSDDIDDDDDAPDAEAASAVKPVERHGAQGARVAKAAKGQSSNGTERAIRDGTEDDANIVQDPEGQH